MSRRHVETRWCPRHDTQIKRGTRRCRSCTRDLDLTVRRRVLVLAGLRPMRAKGDPTKRANERRTKGYVS